MKLQSLATSQFSFTPVFFTMMTRERTTLTSTLAAHTQKSADSELRKPGISPDDDSGYVWPLSKKSKKVCV